MGGGETNPALRPTGREYEENQAIRLMIAKEKQPARRPNSYVTNLVQIYTRIFQVHHHTHTGCDLAGDNHRQAIGVPRRCDIRRFPR